MIGPALEADHDASFLSHVSLTAQGQDAHLPGPHTVSGVALKNLYNLNAAAMAARTTISMTITVCTIATSP